MQGWLKFHRELIDKPIWTGSTPEQKVILITLLTLANHKTNEWEFKGEKYTVKPGQFITSLPSIVEKCGKGITIQNVRTALKRFEKYEFLTDTSTNKNRLITIVNWGIYQGDEDVVNSQPNRQLTGNQQATNRQLTANKNVIMLENEENEITPSNNTTNPAKMIWDFWDQNGFGYNNLNAKNKLAMFLDEGFPPEVIVKALEIAADRNKISYAYVEGVLKDWDKRSLKTLEAVNAAEAEFKNSMKAKQQPRQGYAKKPVRTEQTPEWFEDNPNYHKPKEDKTIEDVEAKKMSIAEKLKAFNEGSK
jgi:DnaD/phage-associated family protein